MKANKPRLILVARNFPPVVGGIERLMKSTFDVLCDDYEIVLLGPKGSSAHAVMALRIIELPVRISLFLPLALLLAPMLSLIYRPVVVISANGLMSPIAWCVQVFSRARHVGFLHGLDLVSENCLYQGFFLPIIRRTSINIVNSVNTRSLALARGIPNARLEVIHPCIRTPIVEQGESGCDQRMSSYGVYVLYAGRVVPRKGLLEFLDASSDWILAEDVKIVVAGDVPSQNVGSSHEGYASAVLAIIEAKGLTDNVMFLGALTDAQMASCFRHASVHVMPLVETVGDVEGFGMVAVEAASFGTPTVAFDCGGVADAIASKDCLVVPGDYPALQKMLERYYRKTNNPDRWLKWAENFYAPAFSKKLRTLL